MAKDSELEIFSNMDQPIQFNPAPLLNEVDEFYEEALTTNNPVLTILTKIRELGASITMSGLALAKLMYRTWEDWPKFQINDTFEDVIFAYTGKSRVTIDRYLEVWSMYAEDKIPKEFQRSIQSLPVRSQVPIALALRQGHEIEKEEWEKIVNSPDHASLAATMREIKNEPMRKSGLMFVLHRNGDLTATDSEGKTHFIGYLNLKEADGDPVIAKCIARIVDNSYIMRE